MDFESLFAEHRPKLFRFACKLTGGNTEEAEDLMQTATLRALTNWDRFDSKASFKTWFGVILRNHHFDNRRLHRIRKNVPMDESAYEIPAKEVDRRPMEIVEGLMAACQSKRDRTILRLLLEKEGNLGQMASMLGMSPGAFNSRLYKLRGRLRQQCTHLLCA